MATKNKERFLKPLSGLKPVRQVKTMTKIDERIEARKNKNASRIKSRQQRNSPPKSR